MAAHWVPEEYPRNITYVSFFIMGDWGRWDVLLPSWGTRLEAMNLSLASFAAFWKSCFIAHSNPFTVGFSFLARLVRVDLSRLWSHGRALPCLSTTFSFKGTAWIWASRPLFRSDLFCLFDDKTVSRRPSFPWAISTLTSSPFFRLQTTFLCIEVHSQHGKKQACIIPSKKKMNLEKWILYLPHLSSFIHCSYPVGDCYFTLASNASFKSPSSIIFNFAMPPHVPLRTRGLVKPALRTGEISSLWGAKTRDFGGKKRLKGVPNALTANDDLWTFCDHSNHLVASASSSGMLLPSAWNSLSPVPSTATQLPSPFWIRLSNLIILVMRKIKTGAGEERGKGEGRKRLKSWEEIQRWAKWENVNVWEEWGKGEWWRNLDKLRAE